MTRITEKQLSALLEHLERIADAQERTAGAVEELGDRLGDVIDELDEIGEAVKHIN